ncbi:MULTISPECIES: putative entry exclusion protein TrbK-alt [unclassified Sphingopyxis]|uniref:putative entry exclusion protein TrbK-alt n=1 Tax=unclassified Sphingopyxis TaxID=2614943 RepID=UPI0012E3B020
MPKRRGERGRSCWGSKGSGARSNDFRGAADAPGRLPGPPHPAAADVAERCRTVTVADADCEAAWDARRRHFFGQKD